MYMYCTYNVLYMQDNNVHIYVYVYVHILYMYYIQCIFTIHSVQIQSTTIYVCVHIYTQWQNSLVLKLSARRLLKTDSRRLRKFPFYYHKCAYLVRLCYRVSNGTRMGRLKVLSWFEMDDVETVFVLVTFGICRDVPS